MYYIKTKDDIVYPDPPLIGCVKHDVDVNQPFLIKIKAAKEIPAGEYSAVLKLKAADEIVFNGKF